MQRDIEACAGRLAALGIKAGDRVAFLGFNQPMFLFAMFASARLGAIFVPLNFRLTGPELAFMIEDCQAGALIVDETHRAVIEPQIAQLTSLKAVLAAERETQWIDGPPPATAPVRANEDDVALIMYTSGTTGRPKGAMLTHGNIWWNNASGMHTLDMLADDVTLVPAPIFHIGGLNVTTLAAFQKGALVVLHRAFDPGRALADIAAHKVTTMFGVPAMFLFMAQHPGFAETDFSSVRVLCVGGAPCPLPVLKAYLARGVSMQQGYGLTETSPMVSFLAPEYALTKVGSSGRTPMFVEVKVVDSNGHVVSAPRAQGEILVRGPNVTKGYWGMPDATAKAIDADGWFRTGDAGLLRRGGLPHHQRPHQGHDHLGRRERLSGRDREPADAPPGDRRGRGDRRARLAMGRARRRRRRAETGRNADARRAARLRRAEPRPFQAAEAPRDREGAAAQRDRQDFEVSASPDVREGGRRGGAAVGARVANRFPPDMTAKSAAAAASG